jgi:hypothetical protein
MLNEHILSQIYRKGITKLIQNYKRAFKIQEKSALNLTPKSHVLCKNSFYPLTCILTEKELVDKEAANTLSTLGYHTRGS